MSLIPKSIEDKGKTLTLGDVKWSESMDVDGEGNPVTWYTATASYTGEVSKPNCAVVTYTAIFGSEKAPEESKAPDGSENHDPGQTEAPDTAEDLEAAKEPAEQSGLKRPVMIGVVVLALGVGGVFTFKKFKETC